MILRNKFGFSTYAFFLPVHVNINVLLTDYFIHNFVFREELRNRLYIFISCCLISIRAYGRKMKPDLQQPVVRQRWFPWGMAAIVSWTWAHGEEMHWDVLAGSSCSDLLPGNLCLHLTVFTLSHAVSEVQCLSLRKSSKGALLPIDLSPLPQNLKSTCSSTVLSLKREDMWREETNAPDFKINSCSQMASVQGLRCWTCTLAEWELHKFHLQIYGILQNNLLTVSCRWLLALQLSFVISWQQDYNGQVFQVFRDSRQRFEEG